MTVDVAPPVAPAKPAVRENVRTRAKTCPRCEAPASPASAVQTCVHCKKPFVLVAGALLDDAVVPRALPGAKAVKVKYADAVLRHAAIVDDSGVTDTELDPVTGHISVGKRVVPFAEIVSVGLYKRVDWALLVALVLLLLVPVVLPLLVASFSVPPLFLLSLPIAGLFGLGVHKAVRVGVQRMRIVGAQDTITLRFDAPLWKRRKFLAAVVDRAGMGGVPWP